MGIAMGSLASVVTLLGDLRDDFGLTEMQIGLIVGSGFFTAFVTQLTLGRLADRGHAPTMVRFGMMAAATAMAGFAVSSSFLTFVLARAALGFAIGLLQPAIRRTVILTDREHTGRNLGRLGLAEITGFALTPAAAAVLVEVGTLDLPFFVIAATTVATLLAMGRLQPDEALQSVSRESSLQLLRSPVLAGTLLLVTSQFLMIGAWEAVWAISLTDLGAATWTIGLSFTLFALPMAAFAPLGGSIAQRTGGLGLAVAGLSFATAASLLFAVFDSVAALIIVAMFIGVGAGFGYTAGLFVFSQTVDDDRQAAAQGLFGATEVLFSGVSSVLAAWMYDISGRETVWIVMPILAGIAIIGGLALRSSGSHREPQPVDA
jgi:MFS transporter, PPP family, 3-phenylpropionic acid transporter